MNSRMISHQVLRQSVFLSMRLYNIVTIHPIENVQHHIKGGFTVGYSSRRNDVCGRINASAVICLREIVVLIAI